MEKYKELMEEDEEFAEDVFWVPEMDRRDYIAQSSI